MRNLRMKIEAIGGSLLLLASWLVPAATYAKKNAVMGKIEFETVTHVEKTSGVWVDGQYVGYVHELKGSKSVLLLPGVHSVTVRQDGYHDYNQEVSVEPGRTAIVRVAMAKAMTEPFPNVPATVKIAVDPSRAAVFVDGLFVGHVREFEGLGRGMLIAPGEHQIRIALPGYKTFETDIKPLAHQTVELKTHLIISTGPLAEPLIENESSATKPAPQTPNTAAALRH